MHTWCLITVIYGDYDIIPRRELWSALRNISRGIQNEPWLILGDFNAVMDDSEVCGQAADTSASMAEFRSCIRDTSLVPLPFTGCPYTWHNCSEGPRSLWKRLDRVLVNGAWLDAWPDSSYVSALPSTSDHSPLILTGMDRFTDHAIFRFDNYIAQLPGFLDSVHNIWKHRIIGSAMYDVVCKLKILKPEFRRQKKLTGDLTNNVKKAKFFLDKAQAMFDTHKDIFLNLVKCCRQVYSTAIKLEISMLQQRAKLRWLKHGDQNSKVFFRKINSTRVKQRVFQITTASGDILTAQHDVNQEFITYFQNLLGGSSSHRVLDLEFLRHDLKHLISTAEANLLVAPVTYLEVKEAFFDIEIESAPGPDGYTSAFYRNAWPVVGQSMVEAVGEFFRTAITKILVKRLQQVLPLLIDYSQNAFVPGRSIADNILLAQELLAGYNQTRLPARCTLKIDIQKAYDSVEWDFLLEVLRYLIFPDSLLCSLNNALRQPPFLFLLMARFMDSLKEVGDYDRVIRYPLIFLYWSESKPSKEPDDIISSGATGKTTNPGHRGLPRRITTCQVFRYTLTSSRLTISDCRPLIDKVDSKLAGWQHQNLSYAGRLQLIKSVLSTLHTYWASVFILPKGVLKLLEQKMRAFLWHGSSGSGNAKVAWDQLCKPKAEGGLGIRSLIITNQALILKQLWRILQNDGTSIWVDWIQQYRLRHTTLWTFNRSGIVGLEENAELRPILQRGVTYKVGDGSSFSLWQDIWHVRGPLSLNFPRGPEVTGLPLNSKLSSVLQHNCWIWPASIDSDITEIMSHLQHILRKRTQFAGTARRVLSLFKSAILLIQPIATSSLAWPSARCLAILLTKIKFQWPYLEWQQGIKWASKKWRGNHLVNAALRATLAALVYRIWAERNNRKFIATASSAETTSNKVLEDVRMRNYVR
ncbi:UNVERIFIED_CONTAM: hypothetical protein Sradi_7304600 [Sesamum radiatum]|uniref:Reverse transcriptase domain-containing protein n=1 Tax=Sesamum radiatum TaxID=300843 RepID=A0AAW2I817_SESRA